MDIYDKKTSPSKVINSNRISALLLPRVHSHTSHVALVIQPLSPHAIISMKPTKHLMNMYPIMSEALPQHSPDPSLHTSSQPVSMLTNSHPTYSTNHHTPKTLILSTTLEYQPPHQPMLRLQTP